MRRQRICLETNKTNTHTHNTHNKHSQNIWMVINLHKVQMCDIRNYMQYCYTLPYTDSVYALELYKVLDVWNELRQFMDTRPSERDEYGKGLFYYMHKMVVIAQNPRSITSKSARKWKKNYNEDFIALNGSRKAHISSGRVCSVAKWPLNFAINHCFGRRMNSVWATRAIGRKRDQQRCIIFIGVKV